MVKKYIIRDPQSLNIQFYQQFDEGFLFRKADTLMFVIEEYEAFKHLIEGTGGKIDEPENKFLEGLRAEIHFTEMHQAEGLFALMLAGFKPLPHWLYLTTYRTREIKDGIRAFLNGDIQTLTSGKLGNPGQFIQYAVYSGFKSTEPEKIKKWDENIGNVLWLLHSIYEKYISAEEYNAYKHGLRVMTGESELIVHPDNKPELATIIAHSPNSLCFLEIKNIGEGGLTVHETTKHFSYIESYNHILVMYLLLKTIKSSRLAILKGEKGAEINTFFSLDKEKLISESTGAKWSFTV